MVETVIKALIGIAIVVGLILLVLWVLGTLGIVIPGTVMNILYVIGLLVVILILYRIFKPYLGGW